MQHERGDVWRPREVRTSWKDTKARKIGPACRVHCFQNVIIDDLSKASGVSGGNRG